MAGVNQKPQANPNDMQQDEVDAAAEPGNRVRHVVEPGSFVKKPAFESGNRFDVSFRRARQVSFLGIGHELFPPENWDQLARWKRSPERVLPADLGLLATSCTAPLESRSRLCVWLQRSQSQ
jgi:hypothetical protein